jgi:hypothetical protein
MKGKGKRLEKYEWIVILDNKAGTGGEKAGQKRGIPRGRDDKFLVKTQWLGSFAQTPSAQDDSVLIVCWDSPGANTARRAKAEEAA